MSLPASLDLPLFRLIIKSVVMIVTIHIVMWHGVSNAQTLSDAITAPSGRVIVQWRNKQSSSLRTDRIPKASSLTAVQLRHQQTISDNLEVLETADALSSEDFARLLQRLNADPSIQYAAPDLHRQRHAVTSDPLLYEQWYLLSTQPAATRSDAAWDLTQGSSSTIIAVLDTGIRFDHPDIGATVSGGKALPGYDFISNAAVANDGTGRDADASDPGDWVTTGDQAQSIFADCEASNSSWHGTRVAGLVGALTNNGQGVAGAAWNARVLPIRVLGKCGGFDSDIIAGMRWAAGLPVSGVPTNATPATIINMSLGSEGQCTAAYQAAIDEIVAAGVLVVASAGNDGGVVDAPANCAGVLGVAGLRHAGSKVGFSNLGPEIGISAPAGNCVNVGVGQPCLFAIAVATNSGTTTPAASTYTDRINYNIGTSFSAPMVAAGAALMRSVNAALSPSQMITLLQSSATAFPADGSLPACHVPASADDVQTTQCNCTTNTCGAGMLNSGAAVAAALLPSPVVNVTGEPAIGTTLSASAASSFASNERALAAYEWSVIAVSGSTPQLLSPTQAQTMITITGAGQFTLRLTVTDDHGAQASRDIEIHTPVMTVAATTQATGSGGGACGWELLVIVLTAATRWGKRRAS
jgi:serine protease